MLRSQPPDCSPSGNIKKYFSYREAWTRIKESQEQGFYLEAVTLAESIISDRLISYLSDTRFIDLTSNPRRHLSFNDLIRGWKKSVSPTEDSNLSKLQKKVDDWRLSRNKIVHGIVRSHPGLEIDNIESFLENAKKSAAVGEELARAVDKWCKQAKKEAQSNESR
jgi:hypothetical protein